MDQAAHALTAGAKARWYGEPQSQITKAQGEAISIESLKDTQNALLAFSNILIVKIDGVPLVRELTPSKSSTYSTILSSTPIRSWRSACSTSA
ncbi:hypothetical protein [Nonomuraea sp. NPDC003804]|uniref:hypothetical protein n=1 Tax=Nonomuraea sp. NPDC003804 TaxID=3154547 RepID=UPI0033B05C00